MTGPKQEKIELYFYSGIPPKVELRQNVGHVMKAKAITKKFSDSNGSGYKVIVYTDIIPAYVRAGRLKKPYHNGEIVKGWIGSLEQLIMQTKSKKFAFRHVFDNGTVYDYEPYGE